MKHLARYLAALMIAAAAVLPAYPLTIKVGSIAPTGSPWDKALKKIAAEWKTISGGTIDMKIYPGGIVGNEPDMIRKMRIGQLQAAIFTGMGMSYITPDVFALSLPFMVRNDKELDYLITKSAPYLEKLISNKGFSVLVWAKAGWINFFSTKPVMLPKDLKPLKLSVAEGDAELLQAWRVMNFNAIPLATNDIMTGLQNGMIEALYAPPLVAASFQWFGIAKHMCTIQIAPLMGGIVLTKKTWDEIPAGMRPKLKKSAQEVIETLYVETSALEKSAMDTMVKNGLQIHRVPAGGEELWRQEAVKGHNAYVGKTFSREFYNRLQGYLKEFREKK